MELADCGATLCDVMGDYFDPCEGELTMNEEAVKKQMALIDALHARGAEVLMSSHVLKFTPAERVLEIAREHERRGDAEDACREREDASPAHLGLRRGRRAKLQHEVRGQRGRRAGEVRGERRDRRSEERRRDKPRQRRRQP